MKKILLIITLILSIFLTSCNTLDSTKPSPSLSDNDSLNVKEAYLNALAEQTIVKSDEVEVVKCHLIYNNCLFVTVVNKLGLIPYKITNEKVNILHFQYRNDETSIYGVIDGVLYTIRQVYEMGKISLNELTDLFVINSASTSLINRYDIEKIKNGFFINDKIFKSTTILTRYYGQYKGYYAVEVIDNINDKNSVAVSENIDNLTFRYPSINYHIYFINNDTYTIAEAYQKNIIDKHDLINIFMGHTQCEEFNDNKLLEILMPIWGIYKQVITDYNFDNLGLVYYFGYYDYCDIFSFSSKIRLYSYIKESDDAFYESLRLGTPNYIYVLYNNEIFLLDDAVEKGYVSAATKQKINTKKQYIM